MYKSRTFECIEMLEKFLNDNKIPKENIIKLELRWTGLGVKPFLVYIDQEATKTEQNQERKTEKAQKKPKIVNDAPKNGTKAEQKPQGEKRQNDTGFANNF